MTNTPTNPIVEMYVDGEWVDITGDVRLGEASSGGDISIKRGRGADAPSAEPTEVEFVLNNGVSKAAGTEGQSGVYSLLNPAGPYYGLLNRNQPIRVGVNRRTDSFNRTAMTDWWGNLPDWTDTENAVHPGEEWQITGTTWNFDTTGTAATIQAAAGFQAATFGVYGDVDILTRVQVSNRTSEFGIVLRLGDNVPDQADGTFESGVGEWQAFNATVSSSTAQVLRGTRSALLIATAIGGYLRPFSSRAAEVSEGEQYKIRAFARQSITDDIYLAWDWFDADFNYVTSSYSGPFAATANVWLGMEFTATVPAGATYGTYGIGFDSSAAIGTQMYVDHLSYQRVSDLAYYTAYITPSTTDLIRIGRVSPGYGSATSNSLSANIVAGTSYWMRAQVSGQRFRAKLWQDGTDEPSSWGVAYFDNSTLRRTPIPLTGSVGLFAKDGSALVTFDSIQVDQWRAHAELAQFPTRYDLSRRDRWVPVLASGILRRIGQGRQALNSPAYQYLKQYLPLSAAWLPLEAAYSSGLATNAISSGPPGSVLNVTYAAPDAEGEHALPGVAGYAKLDEANSYVTAYAQRHTGTGSWTVLCFFRLDADPASEILLFQYSATGGTAANWYAYLTTAGQVRIEARTAAGALIQSGTETLWGFGDIPIGSWVACTLYVFQSGGNVVWAWNYHRPGFGIAFYTNNDSFIGTVGKFTRFRAGSSAAHVTAGCLHISHVFHYAGDLPFVDYDFSMAAAAYDGETTTARFLRLTRDAGIRGELASPNDEPGEVMGPQQAGKLLDLLDECAEVEHGVLVEARDAPELTFYTRPALYNPRLVSLDIDEGHLSPPLDPTPDDQGTRNAVRVRNLAGAFAASIQTEGPLNVNPPEDDPDGVGEYPEDPEINLGLVTFLQSAADWRRSLGTLVDPRYPSITADLAANAYQASSSLTAEVMALDTGRAIEVTNTEVTPDPHTQIVHSYTEKLGQYDWSIALTTTPATVHTQLGRVGINTRVSPAGSVTAGAFGSGSDTTLEVERLDSSHFLWATTADDPDVTGFDIMVSGVRLRVVSISGTSDPQTITVEQEPINGVYKTIPAGERVTLFEPWRIAWGAAVGLGAGQIANDQDFRSAGQGQIGKHVRATSISGITTETGYIRIDNMPLRNGYDYEIIVSPVNITTSTTTGAIGMTRIRANPSGVATTSSTSIAYQRSDQTTSTSQTNVGNLIAFYTATADSDGSFLVTVARVGGTGTVGLFGSAADYVTMTVKEVGPTPDDTGVDV